MVHPGLLISVPDRRRHRGIQMSEALTRERRTERTIGTTTAGQTRHCEQLHQPWQPQTKM